MSPKSPLHLKELLRGFWRHEPRGPSACADCAMRRTSAPRPCEARSLPHAHICRLPLTVPNDAHAAAARPDRRAKAAAGGSSREGETAPGSGRSYRLCVELRPQEATFPQVSEHLSTRSEAPLLGEQTLWAGRRGCAEALDRGRPRGLHDPTNQFPHSEESRG